MNPRPASFPPSWSSFLRHVLLAGLWLAACRPAPSATPTSAPTFPPPTVANPPAPTPTFVPLSPSAPATLLPTAAPATPAATASPGSASVASPVLPEFVWDDRSPFAPGLIAAQQSTLAALPGASIYHLDLELAPDLATITGSLAVRYTNQEDTALESVAFHLHPNVLGGAMTVTNPTVDGVPVAADHTPGRAAMPLPLPSALPPGGQVVLAMDFAVTLPASLERNYGVLAVVEGAVALAHFYPMVAVYDDDGWNTAPPPSNGDVSYADASFYLVRVRAPAGLVLAGAGRELSASSAEGTQTVTYALGPARDFYLAASPDYQRLTAQAGEVTVNSYAPAAWEDASQAALDTAVATLADFSLNYGPYPYTELDLVAIHTLALGIEYPGLIAQNRSLYDPGASFGGTPRAVLLESTVAHEVGHQWFYNLVGNDQLDEPWLDESLTQYVTWRYYARRYGPDGEAGWRAALDSRWDRVDHAPIPIGLPAGSYSGTEYGAIVYGRGAFFFEALAGALGPAAFEAFLLDYTQTYQWQIATGPALKHLAEQHCACDLTQLFDEWGALP